MRPKIALKGFIIFVLLGFSQISHGATEFSAQFGYKKNVYGADRQNSLVNRSYSGSLATFLFSHTALEFNYSYSEEITTENNTIAIEGTTVSVTGLQNKVKNIVYGIGIRQALSGRKSLIRPLISLGYAKQFIKDSTDFTFYDSNSSTTIISPGDVTKSRQDSLFGSFSLQIRLSQQFSIEGTVKTVFPADEFNQAKDNLEYLAGLNLWW